MGFAVGSLKSRNPLVSERLVKIIVQFVRLVLACTSYVIPGIVTPLNWKPLVVNCEIISGGGSKVSVATSLVVLPTFPWRFHHRRHSP